MRFMLGGIGLALVVSGCGGGELSLTEYVDQLNAISSRAIQRFEALMASPQGEVLVADADQINDFTPQDLAAALERAIEISVELKEAADAIEPPQQVADLHHRMFHDKYTFYDEALADRASTAADWEELSESPEMIAFRAAIAEDKQTCIDLQNDLDATEARGDFADTPWLPSEMKEIVNAVLGCAIFPETPEDLFRYPPSVTIP